jgi:predicted GTPase
MLKGTDVKIMLIDTPGILEGDEQDKKNVNNVIITLQLLKYITSILIVMNG